jgi:hypothetical protein
MIADQHAVLTRNALDGFSMPTVTGNRRSMSMAFVIADAWRVGTAVVR